MVEGGWSQKVMTDTFMQQEHIWRHLHKPVPLLENEPSEPVEEVLKHRFYNRYPQTETIGLGLEHRVFHPVP